MHRAQEPRTTDRGAPEPLPLSPPHEKESKVTWTRRVGALLCLARFVHSGIKRPHGACLWSRSWRRCAGSAAKETDRNSGRWIRWHEDSSMPGAGASHELISDDHTDQ